MQVSRITVQALYSEARKKLARFLVEGNHLEIRGGNYCIDTDAMDFDGRQQKGDMTMILAVTYENGEVFQHFGHTETFKIYQIEDAVVKGYKGIENAVVGGYKKIEEGVVDGFNKVSDTFIDKLFTREGETVEEAKARMNENIK